MSRWAVDLRLSAHDRRRLEEVAGDQEAPRKHVQRARIVLLSDGTRLNGAIAAGADVSLPTVHRWQRRFQEGGVDGLLRDKTRPPGTPPLAPEMVQRVLATARNAPPDGASRWSSRSLAEATGVSPSSVRRIWKAHMAENRTEEMTGKKDEAWEAFTVSSSGRVAFYRKRCATGVMCANARTRKAAVAFLLPALPGYQAQDDTLIHPVEPSTEEFWNDLSTTGWNVAVDDVIYDGQRLSPDEALRIIDTFLGVRPGDIVFMSGWPSVNPVA